MNKINYLVPKGIRYISELNFQLPETPSVVNKKLTGCGFTEWAITCPAKVILVSPRRILLENKASQHPESNVIYFRNDGETEMGYDRDVQSKKSDKSSDAYEKNKDRIEAMKSNLQTHFMRCCSSGQPCKILVTYDSFRLVKEALGNAIWDFYIVVDEFQAIWTDAKFKSDTEMELLHHLHGLSRICFVSATPMIEDYMNELDEFKDLPFIEFDWETYDPGRVKKPDLGEPKACTSILKKAYSIVESYQQGKFELAPLFDSNGNYTMVESREAVIYVNSVKHIYHIIKHCGLTPSNTNVLCARTEENEKLIRKAFGITDKSVEVLGRVPKRGEYHKMFTLCTRTVYLGADFYSDNARSFILSDANIDALCVDISMDIPQILGRQRNDWNPWKNRAEFYYTTFNGTTKDESLSEFKSRIEEKKAKTESLLRTYNGAEAYDKFTLAEKYERDARMNKYANDYVAVNKHTGCTLNPVFNKLMMLSEIRTYQMQRIDYKDWFSVFAEAGRQAQVRTPAMTQALERFNSFTQFPDKMKVLCDCPEIIDDVPGDFADYLRMFGPGTIKACQYQRYKLNELLSCQSLEDELSDAVLKAFEVGKKYTLKEIKETLTHIYEDVGETGIAKARDLKRWFKVRECMVKSMAKRGHGLEILDRK